MVIVRLIGFIDTIDSVLISFNNLNSNTSSAIGCLKYNSMTLGSEITKRVIPCPFITSELIFSLFSRILSVLKSILPSTPKIDIRV